MYRFASHQDRVTSVAMSPAGDIGCSASRDGTVRFWSLSSGREVRRLDVAPQQVSEMCFSADGNHIALAVLPQTVVLRESATGNEVRRLLLRRDAQAMAFSASKGRFWLLSGSRGGQFDLWDLATGGLLRSFQQPQDAIEKVHLSRDGSRASTVGISSEFGSQPTRLLRVWDMRNGEVLQQCSAPGIHTVTGTGRLLLSENGRRGTLSLGDVDQLSLLFTYPAPESGVALAEPSPDGRHILVASHRGQTYLLDTESGRWRTGPGGCGGDIACAAFSPDGSLVLFGRGDTTELWRVPRFPDAPAGAGIEVRRFVHGGFVYAAKLAPDGRRALTGGFDRALRLWDVSSGTEICRYQGSKPWDVVNDLAWLPDGATVALALNSPSGARLTDAMGRAGEGCATPVDIAAAYYVLRYRCHARCGRSGREDVFSGGLDGECWELHEKSGDTRSSPPLRPAHSMAISPDGRKAVSTAGLEEGAVRVWHCRGHAAFAAPDSVLLLAHKQVRTAVFHPQDSLRVIWAAWTECCVCGTWLVASRSASYPFPYR